MATINLSSTDYTLAAGQSQSVVGEDAFYLRPVAYSPTGPSLFINGSVSAVSGASTTDHPLRAVEVGSGSGSFYQDGVIQIGATGSIHADTRGTFDEAQGIYVGDWGPHIVNAGLIDVQAKTHAWGIDMIDGIEQPEKYVAVVNTGDITVTSEHQATGIALWIGNSIENSGHITVTGSGGVTGLIYSQSNGSLINTGEIRAIDAAGQGIGVQFGSDVGGLRLPAPLDFGVWRNDGLISADVSLKVYQYSSASAANEVFRNNGQMIGAVQMGQGGQSLVNSGSIQGAIDMGSENDIYDGRLGTVTGLVSGGSGDDALMGGAAFDYLQGNTGNDTIDGGTGGSDWLLGGQGDDQMQAHAGDGLLYGNLGNDTISGGSGNEWLRGGQGDDIIVAGAGNDWISGDRGSDTLTGGAGADIFHGFSGIAVDRIVDFNAAEGDRIQLDPGTHYSVSQVGADTVVDLGGGDQMILAGVQSATLPSGWIFGA